MEHKTETKPVAHRKLRLPSLVISQSDVRRLANELDVIDDALLQLNIRSGGQKFKVPRSSRLMDLTFESNKLNILKTEDRSILKKYFILVLAKAPQLHFSFSTDPSSAFLEKLISWLREEIDPHVLLTIGLQPNIGAGCIVRSTNKFFDFSLNQTFQKNKPMLIEKLTLKSEVKV